MVRVPGGLTGAAGKSAAPAPPGGGLIQEGAAARKAAHEAGRRTNSRRSLARHDAFDQVSPEVGELDRDAFEQALRDDPDAALALLADLANATDRQLRAEARRVAARLAVRLGRAGQLRRRGVGRLGVAHGVTDGDLDLDRTIDRAGVRPWRADDLTVRHWQAPTRSVCLLVDRSGSMRDSAVMLAAVAAAAVVVGARRGGAGAGSRIDASVLAFAHDVTVLQGQGGPRPVSGVVGDLLSLRGHGTTNLALGLRAARRQLERGIGGERVAIVLSDCLATIGDPPLAAAHGIERLHVLGTDRDTESVAAGQALARRGGGRYALVESVGELAPALNTVLR